MFLVNNLLFVLLTFTVLIGTVFPLVVEAVKGKQMSVGRPYFDQMVVPAGTALLFLLGVGPALPWGRARKGQALRALLAPIAAGVVVAAIGYALGVTNIWTLVTLAFGGYAAHVTLAEMWTPVVSRMRRGESAGRAVVQAQLRRGRRRFGSYLVHAGAVIVIVSIAVSSTMRTTREFELSKGQRTSFGPWTMVFDGAEQRPEPHRLSTIARFTILKNGKTVASLAPRMNQYATMREPVGSPDVYSTLKGDFYLSLLNVDTASQRTAVTVYITPMVGWIWIAVVLMGFGGLVALIPNRSPAAVPSEAREPVMPQGVVAES